MYFSLSTRWNACRHTTGEAMIEEILALGFKHVELGYDLTVLLVPGVRKMVNAGAICVDSVHAYCPIPSGLPYGHPELYNLLAPLTRARKNAIEHVVDTVHFAGEVGASTVVLHGGNISLGNMTQKLILLYEQEEQFSDKYDKIKTSLMMKREAKAKRNIEYLYDAVEQLIPVLEETGVNLAFENLPTWEAIPSESETFAMINHFKADCIKYWHDMGHGHVRQTLGFVSPIRWLEDLLPHLAGMHVHDVIKPAGDHIMPPSGEVDFAPYARFMNGDIPAVLEPYPGLPAEDITGAVKFLSSVWKEADNTKCGRKLTAAESPNNPAK